MTTLFRSHPDEVIHILSRCTEAEPCRVCAPIDAPEPPVRLTECGSERHLAPVTPDDQREPRAAYVCDCHRTRHEVEIA